MLGLQLVGDIERRLRQAGGVAVHVQVRQARPRDVLGGRDQALRARHGFEPHGVAHDVGFHEVQVLPVARRIDALPGQRRIGWSR